MIRHLTNRTFTVYRPATTDDGAGGQITTRPPVGDTVMRVSQPSSADRYAAMHAGATLDAQLYGTAAADVRRGDELWSGGEVYEVIATVYPSVPGAYLRADCERIQREGE